MKSRYVGRELTIIPVMNGFIVQLGCQKLVFNSLPLMTKAITDYYSNPTQSEKEWIEECGGIANVYNDGPQPVDPVPYHYQTVTACEDVPNTGTNSRGPA